MTTTRLFKGAVLEVCGVPLSIRELEIPPLAWGQVLVHVHYSGVCRSQLMEVMGLRGTDPWLPHLLGHEGVGTVVEIGPGVTKVTPGQKVIIGWIKSSGISSLNPVFTSGTELIHAGAATTFAEMAVTSENRLYLKPEELSDKSAVLFGCALLTGAGMVINELPPRPSDKVVIFGLGGVGLAALIGALTTRPALIIAVDPSREKRDLALALGADIVLDPSTFDFKENIRDVTGGGADMCFEAGGTAESIELALQSAKDGSGTVLFASHPPKGDRIRVDPFDLISGKQLRGSWGGGSQPDTDIPRIAKAVSAHGINLESLLTTEYALEDVNQALADLEGGRSGRPLLRFDVPSGKCENA